VGFEPTVSAGERPQIYALDRAATGTGGLFVMLLYLSAFVGQCTEHTTVLGVSNIQFCTAGIQKWPAYYVTRRMLRLSHYGGQRCAFLS